MKNLPFDKLKLHKNYYLNIRNHKKPLLNETISKLAKG